jgi:hypothetical protein
MATGTSIRVGDRVSWNTPQGRTRGEVVERRTSDFRFADQDFTATAARPKFIVKSEKTGAEAAHATSALRKLRPKRAG